MNKLLSLGFLLFAHFTTAQSLKEYISLIPPTGPIMDNAGLLTDKEETELLSFMRVSDEHPLTYQVVTVSTLAGYPPEDMAQEMRETWEIGGSDGKIGVLILVAPHEREVYISTGKIAQRGLPDVQLQRILDIHMFPKFKRDNYLAGLRAGIRMMKASYNDEYYTKRSIWIAISLSFVGIVFFGLILIRKGYRVTDFGSHSSSGSSGYYSNDGGFSGGGGSSFGGGGGGGGGGAGGSY
ncbi:MAG TPA: hypothetical protein DCE41_33745 [Cytophagales bacterium]|nr:hypothetical protein [Cytophagales bacterium]